MASDLQDALMVRPTQKEVGTKIYHMEWVQEEKKVLVNNLNGEWVATVPGKWTKNKQLGEALLWKDLTDLYSCCRYLVVTTFQTSSHLSYSFFWCFNIIELGQRCARY